MKRGPKTYFTKEYIWLLYQFHRDVLTKKQQLYIQSFLDGKKIIDPNNPKADRRWIYNTIHRLYDIESGFAKRKPQLKAVK